MHTKNPKILYKQYFYQGITEEITLRNKWNHQTHTDLARNKEKLSSHPKWQPKVEEIAEKQKE